MSNWVGCLSEALASPYSTPLPYSLRFISPSAVSPLTPNRSLCHLQKLILRLPLTRPGIAVDKRGVVYFVDGTTIQKINERGLLSTVIGSNGLMSTQPLSCDARMDISQVS